MIFKYTLLLIVCVLSFGTGILSDTIDFSKPVLSVVVVESDSVDFYKYQAEIESFLFQIREEYVGKRLFESLLKRDMDKLFLLGYFEKITVQTFPKEHGVELRFIVKPNPIVKDVVFQGVSVISESYLKTLLYHQLGVVFNSKYFNLDLESIKEFYTQKGYDLIQIEDAYLDSERRLVFRLNEGFVRSIRWEGLSKIDPFILNRRFRTQAGSVFNSYHLRKDRELLLTLDYFSDVSYPRLQERLDTTEIDIIFSVTEKKSNRVGLGLELEQRDGDVVGFFRGDLHHLLMHSDRLSGKIQLDWAENQVNVRTYSLHYLQPWFLNWIPVSFQTDLWWTTQFERVSSDFNTHFQNTRVGGDVGFKVPFLYEKLFLSSRFRIENVSPNLEEELSTLELSSYKIQSFSFQAQYFDLDDRFNPGKGFYWYAETERGIDLGLFDNTLNFSRYRFDASTFFELNSKGVFGIHVGLGYFLTKQQIATFEHEKFEVGGAMTLRGFQETHAFIGDRKVLFNMEYRWNVTDKFQWVIFYDIGKTFDSGVDLSFDTFHQGRGVGVRFFTPLGPIRFDLAQGVQAGTNDSNIVLHFSLGQLF